MGAELSAGAVKIEITASYIFTDKFDVENENIKGHWTGIFYDHRGRTTIDFTEKVTVKKFFLRPFVGRYLRKQQLSYVSDLKKKTETYVEKDN